LTGPQYNPDDGWQANHYPLSQTGPEKTEFPIEIDAGKSWADFGKQIVNLFDEHGGAMAGAATGVAIAVFLLPGAGAVILVGSALITGGAGYIVGGVSDSELKKADIRKALREQGIEIDKENIAIETLHEQMEKGESLTEELIAICEEYNHLTEKEWDYIYQGQATMAAGEIILESPAIIAALKGILDSGKEIGSNLKVTIQGWLNKGGSEKLPSAKGLIGHDFEDYLHKNIGGDSQYIKGSTAGRDFDGVIGNRWYEAKSGNYWNKLQSDKTVELKFKQKMSEGLKIAQEHNATYELFSNTPIPENIKDWLTKKGIPFTEILH
ncbi:MAG: hypothetical protein KH353_12980, partial [Clostridium sp.]|nr:hypothetical protein [Clostridium sp.]